MGSGWATLVWEPIGKRLLITQIYDHQSNLAQGGVPLMVIDAWEHAYYLQYQNRKAEFFEAMWAMWNWRDITARYASNQTHHRHRQSSVTFVINTPRILTSLVQSGTAFVCAYPHSCVQQREGRIPMLLLIILVVLLFGGGGGYYGYSRWGSGGGIGVVGLVLIVVVLIYAFGGVSLPR